ncbi:uncharacterized protein CTRU02_208715 [Colletotrichum truncatum]|uniref:Uncharacterized protein n=1 Tax=Colletotrichum truncatum TaxID=5467 RepID=A0ACC3YX53_COLTU
MVPLSKMTLSKVTNARGHETALSLSTHQGMLPDSL